MNVRLLGFAAAGLMLLAADDPTKNDKVKIQGTWKVEAVTLPNGKPLPADELPDVRMTFDGDKVVMTQDGKKVEEGTFALDPGKKPSAIDLLGKEGKTGLQIYQLDGDTLKLASAGEGKDRPTDFEAKGISITVLKRQKK